MPIWHDQDHVCFLAWQGLNPGKMGLACPRIDCQEMLPPDRLSATELATVCARGNTLPAARSRRSEMAWEQTAAHAGSSRRSASHLGGKPLRLCEAAHRME